MPISQAGLRQCRPRLDILTGYANDTAPPHHLGRLELNPPAATDARPEIPEFLSQALRAMNEGRDADAVALLKSGLEADPANGIVHFLLGSLHAQSGMIDRAIADMTRAVECAPQLEMARFQLGLLQFTSMNVPAAEAAWAPFAQLPENHPLALFRSGLLHLARDEFAACIDDLLRGISLNVDTPALNRNMEMVIEKAELALRSQNPAPADSGHHVLLAGYHAAKPPTD